MILLLLMLMKRADRTDFDRAVEGAAHSVRATLLATRLVPEAKLPLRELTLLTAAAVTEGVEARTADGPAGEKQGAKHDRGEIQCS